MRWPRLWSGVLRLCDPRGLHRELGLIRCKLDLAGFQVQIYLSQVVLALVHESSPVFLKVGEPKFFFSPPPTPFLEKNKEAEIFLGYYSLNLSILISLYLHKSINTRSRFA